LASTCEQLARQLLESYVALGSGGLAEQACRDWRTADPSARLDPALLSPKLIAACSAGERRSGAEHGGAKTAR